MKKFLIEIFSTTAMLVLVWAFLFQSFKIRMMPYDFAMWKSKFDMASTSGHSYKIIVLGDSLPNAGINPLIINQDMYNLSLGGSTPIDAYSLLQIYLENHKAPETIIISFAGTSLYSKEVFKHHTLSFMLHPLKVFIRLLRDIHNFPGFYQSGLSLPKRLENFLIKNNEEEIIYATDMILSFLNLNKYQISFNQNIFSSKVSRLNQDTYKQSLDNHGQHFYSEEKRNSLIKNPQILPTFSLHPIIDKNFKQLIQLCAESNIKVILVPAPINEIYKSFLLPSYFLQYSQYFTSLVRDQKNMLFVNYFPFYAPEFFSDPDHVNSLGMVKYSAEIKGLLDSLNH